MTWLTASDRNWRPPQGADGAPEGAMFAPAAGRNVAAICAALCSVLADVRGSALEIGSGTGQHVTALAHALPQLTWLPSDPSPQHRVSIAAWAAQAKATNLHDPIDLDATTGPPWPPPVAKHAVIYCANVIHIAPPSVLAGILTGASHHLVAGGKLIFYGPFARDGVHTAPSNEAFDAALRARDPDWGVRDLTAVMQAAADQGLAPGGIHDMPANNLLVVLQRTGE